MAVAFRASAVGGNGQSATTTTVSLTIPATAVAGDVAMLVAITSGNTVTTPTGWTLQSGPDAATSTDSYMYTKTLVSGDVGATLTLTCSAAGRFMTGIIVVSGATETGLVFGAVTNEASTTAPTLPTVVSIPANSFVATYFTRRRGGTPAATVTVPTGYTATGNGGTSYGALPEMTLQGGYKTITTAGTYGGEAGTGSSATVGNNYLVAFPPAVVAFSGTVDFSGSGTLTDTGIPKMTGTIGLSGSGTLTASGSPVGRVALAGSGTLTASGFQVFVGSVALSGSGTVSFTGVPKMTGTVPLSGSGTVSFTGKPNLKGTLAVSGSGTLTLTGKPGYKGTVGLSGVGTLSQVRLASISQWNGVSWQSLHAYRWTNTGWVQTSITGY